MRLRRLPRWEVHPPDAQGLHRHRALVRIRIPVIARGRSAASLNAIDRQFDESTSCFINPEAFTLNCIKALKVLQSSGCDWGLRFRPKQIAKEFLPVLSNRHASSHILKRGSLLRLGLADSVLGDGHSFSSDAKSIC